MTEIAGEGPSARPSRPSSALPPLVAAALDANPGSVLERLRSIAAHSSTRGRYTELGLISEGAGGRVLRVWDEDLQREVALKEFATELPADATEDERRMHEERLARFIDEARVTSQLDHPGIVSVHEIAADRKGRVYYTMPLVRGQTFAQVIDRVVRGDPEWPLARAVGVLATVCDAMAYAHACGVVHRDLKPQNVLVGCYGEAIVMDWGVAQVLGRSDAHEADGVVGTPAYMAPEVLAEGGSIAADVYALGAMLYALLVGGTPHEATVMEAQGSRPLHEIVSAPPRRVRQLAPEAPPELAAIVDRAMARHARERYPDAGVLGADLRAWLEGRVVTAFESGLLAEVRKWSLRNRGLVRALQALVALVVVASGVVAWRETLRAHAVAAKADEVERKDYASSLRAAALSLRAGEAGDARVHLDSCDPGKRGWEWQHLALAADSSVLAVHPFGGKGVKALALGPHAALLAAGGADGRVALLDATTLAPRIPPIQAHQQVVRAVVFSPDGARVASCGEDGLLVVSDAESGAEVARVDLQGGTLRALVFHPDGERLFVVDSDDALRLVDPRDGTSNEVARGSGASAALVLVGSPLRLLASLGDGVLRSFDPAKIDAPPVVRPLRRDVRSLAPLPEDLVAVGTWGGEILVVAAATLADARPPFALVDERILTLASRPDDGRLAVGTSSGAVHVLDALAPNPAATHARLLGHSKEVDGLVQAASTGAILSGSTDGSVRAWRADRAAVLAIATDIVLPYPALSGDGARVVCSSRTGELGTWDLDTGMLVGRQERSEVFPVAAFVGGGDGIAIGGRDPATGRGVLRIVDARTGEERSRLDAHETAVLSLAADDSGTVLASRGADGTACVWDVPTREARFRLTGLDDSSEGLALSRRGTTLAVQSREDELLLVDARTGVVVRTIHTASVITSLALESDGKAVLVGELSGRVARWPREPARRERVVLVDSDAVRALAVSPDGTRLATAGHDHSVRLWDAATGDALLTLRGHDDRVSWVAFTPGGSSLVSASADGVVRLWRTRQSLSH